VTDEATADGDDTENDGSDGEDGERFGVGIRVTESDLRFVVHVPSDIDSGWSDPESFQSLVERRTWEHLDQESTLRMIAAETPPGETVSLGHLRLTPDGTVVDVELSPPAPNE